jgi:2-polyprenyl-3-methyl-5-hydroxy-6-metoxy-1,4-benzoquinol methylase
MDERNISMNIEKTALRPCPVCGGKQVEVFSTMRYEVVEGFPLPAENDIVACLGCGMVYTDTSGTQADYDRYYAGFANYESPKGIGSGGLEKDARRLEETADWLAARIGAKNARVVDIGCAQGGLLAALLRRGFSSLAGIDPSARCVELLKAAGFFAWQGHFGHIPAECTEGSEGVYDFMIATHVLEHVLYTHEAFSSLRQLLAPGGKIYIEVPNAANYRNGKGTLPFQEINLEHINHFDLPHLTMLCELHGFKVAEVYGDASMTAGKHPAFGVLLSGENNRNISFSHEKDKTRLKRIITTYIIESQERLSVRIRVLSGEIKDRPVVLWGMGMDARLFLAHPAWKGMNFAAIVDSDPRKQRKTFSGHVVQAPEKGLRDLPGNTLVVISAAHYAEEIRHELNELYPGLASLVLTDEA